ncbi:MAG: hypothetical protein LW636_00785 [Planctomycetaceae bacterium]|nr:hypothetical protein [Planctomycetaceae bacterium]
MRRSMSTIVLAACLGAASALCAVDFARGEGGAPPPPRDGAGGGLPRLNLARVFFSSVYPQYLDWLDQSPAAIDSAGAFQMFLILRGYSPELQSAYMQIYLAYTTPNETA